MKDEVLTFSVSRFTREGGGNIKEVVARESPVAIILNGRELATLLCSPMDLKYLAVGFLLSEGLIKSKDDIKEMTVDDGEGVVRLGVELKGRVTPKATPVKGLVTSSGGKEPFPHGGIDATVQAMQSHMRISTSEIINLVREFQNYSPLYLTTHGVHSAALCDSGGILAFSEDIGRHNAIDKIFGKCLIEDIPTVDRILLTSGRVSSDSVYKIARRGVSVIISIAVPTDFAVKLANEFGITLVGRVTNESMIVYANSWRILRG
jgi:FdhD protein